MMVAASSAHHARTGWMTMWSPYQKLDVTRLDLPPRADAPRHTGEQAGYVVKVNNVSYQAILNLSTQFRAVHPDLYDQAAPNSRVHSFH